MREWISRQPKSRILHIFERACNLIGEGDEIVSLVTKGIGPGPFAIVLSNARSFNLIHLESPVSISGTLIEIGPLTIETDAARLWHPQPAWGLLRQGPAVLDAYLPVIWKALPSSSIAESPLTAAVQSRLASAEILLLQGLDAGDLDVCRHAVRRLAGVGAGSTPAGDDYLIGVIYALWATRPEPPVRKLAGTLVEAAVPLTTTLSAAWLGAASRGEAAEPWHELVEGIARQDDFAVEQALRRIVSTGHTSGIDALAGFTAALTRARFPAARSSVSGAHSLT